MRLEYFKAQSLESPLSVKEKLVRRAEEGVPAVDQRPNDRHLRAIRKIAGNMVVGGVVHTTQESMDITSDILEEKDVHADSVVETLRGEKLGRTRLSRRLNSAAYFTWKSSSALDGPAKRNRQQLAVAQGAPWSGDPNSHVCVAAHSASIEELVKVWNPEKRYP